eukprot:365427-Chlamydomonas_euryale.AAC.13
MHSLKWPCIRNVWMSVMIRSICAEHPASLAPPGPPEPPEVPGPPRAPGPPGPPGPPGAQRPADGQRAGEMQRGRLAGKGSVHIVGRAAWRTLAVCVSCMHAAGCSPRHAVHKSTGQHSK